MDFSGEVTVTITTSATCPDVQGLRGPTAFPSRILFRGSSQVGISFVERCPDPDSLGGVYPPSLTHSLTHGSHPSANLKPQRGLGLADSNLQIQPSTRGRKGQGKVGSQPGA